MAVVVGAGVVRVAPDLTGFHAKIKAELAAIKDQLRIAVDVDSGGASAQLAAVKAEALAAGKDIHINVDVDSGLATAQLAAVGAEAAAVGGPGGPLGEVASTAAGAAGGLGRMASSAIFLAPALGALISVGVTLAAVLGGVVVALAAPVGAAVAGGGLFAFLAGKYIGQTNKVAKQIDELKKRADSLKDPKLRAQALADAAALEKSLTGPQKAFLAAKETLRSAFSTFTSGPAGKALLTPITAAMNLLATVLPKVTPLIQVVSTAISGLLDKLSAKVKGGGLDAFIATLSKLAGPAIKSIGSILGSIGSSLFSVLKGAAPTGQSLIQGMADKLKQLAAYLKSPKGQKEIREFFDWVKENGPKIATQIGHIAVALKDFGKDIEPIGKLTLRIADAVSKLYSWLHKLGALKLSNFLPGGLGNLGRSFGLASGGIAAGPQHRLIGEDGPEAVVPLNRNLSNVDPSVRALSAIAQGKAGPSAGATSGASVTQHIYPQPYQSESDIGRHAANRLLFALGPA